MSDVRSKQLRIAVIDLYNGEANEGMRCIRELVEKCSGRWHNTSFDYEVFDARAAKKVPGLEYDVYISSGGPGSPYEGVGKPWEQLYFNWLRSVWRHNQTNDGDRKHVFFICHSFQMMCRFFHLGDVRRRRSESFGIFPVHKTRAGEDEPLFSDLEDPFFAADFRKWQVVQPDHRRLREIGGEILALEKVRPHVELERAVMGIRITPEMVGVQFHPEADADGMLLHFSQKKRREFIVEHHGEEKYARIIHRLKDPSYLDRTHRAVLPTFLKGAVEAQVTSGETVEG